MRSHRYVRGLATAARHRQGISHIRPPLRNIFNNTNTNFPSINTTLTQSNTYLLLTSHRIAQQIHQPQIKKKMTDQTPIVTAKSDAQTQTQTHNQPTQHTSQATGAGVNTGAGP
jgi:hypothetical protein